MKDEIFGEIEWTGDHWTTAASVPYFRGAGERVLLTREDRQDLSPEGTVTLNIETRNESRRRPSALQFAAWDKIRQRGDAVWAEVMDALIAEYQLQRPNRVRYWKVLNGSRLLSRSLPAAVDRKVMKELVLPIWCHVQPPNEERGTVDVYLTLMATWWSEAVNVYVRDGHVTEVTNLGSVNNRKLPFIETSTFGTLRRRPASRGPWWGEVRLAPFESFAAIAIDRTLWDESYTRSDKATSDLPWAVARGEALLAVHTKPNRPPTERQAAAFAAFVQHLENYAPTIIEIIFDYYKKTVPAHRARRGSARRAQPNSVFPRLGEAIKNTGGSVEAQTAAIIGAFAELLDGLGPPRHPGYSGRARAAALPVLKNANGLQDLTELPEVNVFPDERSGPIGIGLLFRGTWTRGAGLGILWRDGRIEQVGEKEVAIPPTRS